MFKRRFESRKRRGGGKWHRRRKQHRPHHSQSGYEATLADVPAGCKAKVMGFKQHLPADRLSHLQAYGLTPGHKVRVLQHSPVTVIQIEHTELALERDLAKAIQITDIEE